MVTSFKQRRLCPFLVFLGPLGGQTRQLAMEGREHGIRANSISPGLTETNQTREQLKDPEWAAAMLGKTLLGRLCRPES